MVARQKSSDYQILAQFAEFPPPSVVAHRGGRAAELAAKGIGEMAVAGKAEVEGQGGDVVGAAGQSLQRCPQA